MAKEAWGLNRNPYQCYSGGDPHFHNLKQDGIAGPSVGRHSLKHSYAGHWTLQPMVCLEGGKVFLLAFEGKLVT